MREEPSDDHLLQHLLVPCAGGSQRGLELSSSHLIGPVPPRPRGYVQEGFAAELTVKSRHRVKRYGEVFTPRRMVNQMLDLVREDLELAPDFVDRTFLEPAAGDGNFLVAILTRKLRVIVRRHPEAHWQHESLFALASIYGIELLEDNHRDAKLAMLSTFVRFHEQHGVSCGPKTNLLRAAAFLIDANVVCGNTLTGLDLNGREIQFSWWTRVVGADGKVQRQPFTFTSMRESVLDFTVYESYKVCRIDQVHKQGGVVA